LPYINIIYHNKVRLLIKIRKK